MLEVNYADAHQVTLSLHIPADIAYFNGHFPTTPILAGVVQVDWALHFAAEHLELDKNKFTGAPQLKFSQLILPGATLQLELTYQNGTLRFRYYHEAGVYSKGKLAVRA